MGETLGHYRFQQLTEAGLQADWTVRLQMRVCCFAQFGNDDTVGSLPLWRINCILETCIEKKWEESWCGLVQMAECSIADTVQTDSDAILPMVNS